MVACLVFDGDPTHADNREYHQSVGEMVAVCNGSERAIGRLGLRAEPLAWGDRIYRFGTAGEEELL